MYAGTAFLSQYFQLSRDKTPTTAGIMTLPLILGLALASTVAGRIITATGRWKPFLVAGAVLVTAGVCLLSLVISFFRTLGGTIGVSVLGAVLASHVSRHTTAGLARLGAHAPGGSPIPALPALSAPVRSIVEDAFGHGTGDLFLYVTPFALLSLISILCIKEVPLRTSSALQAHRDD
jgi:MFS family permease